MKEILSEVSKDVFHKIDSTSEKINSLYSYLYSHARVELIDALETSDYFTSVGQKRLLREINIFIDDFESKALEEYRKAVKFIENRTNSAFKLAIRDENRSNLEVDYSDYEESIQRSNSESSDYYILIFGGLSSQTAKMKKDIQFEIKKRQILISQRALAESISKKKALGKLKNSFLDINQTWGFIDKSGRKWNLERYLTTFTNATLKSAYRQVLVNNFLATGRDVVRISAHNAKDDCLAYENKLISLTGKVKSLPTLNELVSSGQIFHPFCKHFLIPVGEGEEDAI